MAVHYENDSSVYSFISSPQSPIIIVYNKKKDCDILHEHRQKNVNKSSHNVNILSKLHDMRFNFVFQVKYMQKGDIIIVLMLQIF